VIPSVCRMVHYVSHGSPVRPDGTQAYKPECRSAIVTEVAEWPADISDSDRSNIAVPVGLCVINPSGIFFVEGAMQSEVGREGGTWHWPEQV
jgi:hypothetical protein